MHNRKFREFNYYRVLLYDLYTIYKYPFKKVHEVFNKILSRIYKPVVVVIAALTPFADSKPRIRSCWGKGKKKESVRKNIPYKTVKYNVQVYRAKQITFGGMAVHRR